MAQFLSSFLGNNSSKGFSDKYLFYGFLPKKLKDLEKIAQDLRNYNFNIIFFIPALKINFYIKFFKKYFSKRKIFIAREMTKIHETFYRENLEDFHGFKTTLKGELTVVLSKMSGKYNLQTDYFDENKLNSEIKKYLKRYSLKDVVNLLSEKNKLPKKMIYNLCLKLK